MKIESKTREIRLAHYFNFIRIFFSRKKLWVQPKIKITPSPPIVVEKATKEEASYIVHGESVEKKASQGNKLL